MVSRFPALILVATAVTGCSNATLSTDQETQSVASAARIDGHVSPTPSHAAEEVALQFVDSLRRNEYLNEVADIPADAELSRQDRTTAFRMLEDFARTQEWQLWFTSIDVIDGAEDSVDCYLRGTDGGILVLLLGYHYDVEEWRIDAYEIPVRTFARPEGESYEQYIVRSILELEDGGTPFKDGVDRDGRYFIDHREDPGRPGRREGGRARQAWGERR